MSTFREWRGRVYQGGMLVAAVYGSKKLVAKETAHYALMFAQDGPVKVRILAPRKRRKVRTASKWSA